jgi:hypothetical protein
MSNLIKFLAGCDKTYLTSLPNGFAESSHEGRIAFGGSRLRPFL